MRIEFLWFRNLLRNSVKIGFEVVIESDAGLNSHNSDEDYLNAGASVSTRSEAMSCEIVICISPPDVSKMDAGQILVCVADPFRNPDNVRVAASKHITLMSMDMIPRRLSRLRLWMLILAKIISRDTKQY